MSNGESLQSQAVDSSIWIQCLDNGLSGTTYKVKHAVTCEASPFQKIEVFDTYAFGRILMLAGSVVLTEKDEFIYNEMITHPAMLIHPDPARVCVIGGGDGRAAREALKHDAVKSLTVVEIDELVVKVIRKHFPSMRTAFSDRRTSVVIADGNRFLAKTKEKFDVIIVDSYDPGGPVQSITSEPFFPLVAKRLSPGGIAVFQADSPTLRSDLARHTLRNASAAFAQHRPYVCAIPSFPEGLCCFVIASTAADGLERFVEKRYEAVAPQCRCYTREFLSGAYALPKYVAEALQG
jgi:spermidine synthase